MRSPTSADPLALDGLGALGEEAFQTIAESFASRNPATIVEFGSGMSTVRFARRFPNAEIVSIEHDAGWVERVEALLREHAPASATRIVPRPLALGADARTPGLSLAGLTPVMRSRSSRSRMSARA